MVGGGVLINDCDSFCSLWSWVYQYNNWIRDWVICAAVSNTSILLSPRRRSGGLTQSTQDAAKTESCGWVASRQPFSHSWIRSVNWANPRKPPPIAAVDTAGPRQGAGAGRADFVILISYDFCRLLARSSPAPWPRRAVCGAAWDICTNSEYRGSAAARAAAGCCAARTGPGTAARRAPPGSF